jgi:hypothetical protein
VEEVGVLQIVVGEIVVLQANIALEPRSAIHVLSS